MSDCIGHTPAGRAPFARGRPGRMPNTPMTGFTMSAKSEKCMHTDTVWVPASKTISGSPTKALLDEHAVAVDRAEGRRRADLELGIDRRDLLLERQPYRKGAGQLPQAFQIDTVVRRDDRLDGLVVGHADDDLRRASAANVGRLRLFQRRIGRRMPEHGIWQSFPFQHIDQSCRQCPSTALL